MAWLKGPRSGGSITVDDSVNFTGAILAQNLNSNPWGDVYYVDGDNGSDDYDGLSPSRAFSTIQHACTTALAQDIIYIRPKYYKLGTGFARYTEDVIIAQGGTAGSGETATRAGLSLIGITPRGIPTDFLGVRWKFATNTNLNVEAPATHIENIGFFSESGTYAIYFETDGATRSKGGTDGSSVYNCAIKGDGPLYANGGNELQIVHSRFQAKHDGTVGGINLVGSANAVSRPIIRDCDFLGGNGSNMTDAPIRGASPWHNAFLYDLRFDEDTDTGLYVSISGTTSTGIIAKMYCGSDDISTTSFDSAGIEVIAAYDDDGIQAGADA